MNTIERYGDLVIFVKVADVGTFSGAAKALGVSTSHASRALQRLEDRLGSRLMHRTTRAITLTDAGKGLLERTRDLLAELDAAEAEVTDRGGEPHGTLRVTAPIQFGTRYLAPLAAEFTQLHPGVSVEFGLEDRKVDLRAEGYDLAVRIGLLTDASLVARKLGVTRMLTLASPAYLAANGTPKHPRELADHACLIYLHDAGGPSWRFKSADDETLVRVKGRFASNSGEAILAAVIAGVGIARLPDSIVADQAHAGHVQTVLSPWDVDAPISAVYPPTRHLSPKVRKFVDFLVDKLAPAPWLQCTKLREAAEKAKAR